MSTCGSSEQPSPTNPVDYVAVVDEPGSGPLAVETFTATSKHEKDAKLDELAATGTVVAVDEDEPVAALVTPNDDPNFPNPPNSGSWGLTNAGFTTAWTNGYDGTGVKIAILDTGVTASHEDLGSAKVLQGIDYYAGSDAAPAGDSNYGRVDANGHGTHVAGIAASADNTVGGLGGAPGASILPVRVLGPNGSGFTSDVVAGITWAAAHGADVISMSLGGASCSASEQAALDDAEAQGVVVVAAAGNANSNVPIYPAGFEGEVIAVGATTSSNAKASYSNYGAPFVDLGAPGSLILSTYKDSAGQPANGAYATLSGTSMATPLVAAAVGLVLQRCPAITNGPATGSSVGDKVLALLQSTASPVIPGLGASLLQAGAATAASCPT